MDIKKEVELLGDYLIDLRRYFHENPELSWCEINTQNRICEELDKMNIKYKKICKTGVVAYIGKKGNGKILGIRADIDALPISENTNLDFSSKNENIMHACGHDAHIAILLGTIKILKKYELLFKDEIRLFFQPAEEFIEDSGAKYMVEEKEFKEIDNIIGAHVWSLMPVGKISVEEGPRLASADTFDITIHGKGGHGAMPQECIDPILCSSSVVTALQSVVSREINPNQPVVLSVCSFNSGTNFNIIPDIAKLSGTVRTFNNDVRNKLPEQMERIISNITSAYRTSYEFKFHYGTPATINEKGSSLLAEKSVKKLYGVDTLMKYGPVMVGEDFAKMLNKKPGFFALIGARNEAKGINNAHHTSKFNIDELSMKYGVGLFVQYTLDYFNI